MSCCHQTWFCPADLRDVVSSLDRSTNRFGRLCSMGHWSKWLRAHSQCCHCYLVRFSTIWCRWWLSCRLHRAKYLRIVVMINKKSDFGLELMESMALINGTYRHGRCHWQHTTCRICCSRSNRRRDGCLSRYGVEQVASFALGKLTTRCSTWICLCWPEGTLCPAWGFSRSIRLRMTQGHLGIEDGWRVLSTTCSFGWSETARFSARSTEKDSARSTFWSR